MTDKIDLTPAELERLKLLIGKDPPLKTLAKHYRERKTDYEQWAADLAKDFTIGGKSMTNTPAMLFRSLSERIAVFDGELTGIVQPSVAPLNMTLVEVCDLFARNSWAKNPVIPGTQ